MISEALNIPVPTTVKILKNLNAAGLTVTKEGAGGGILLTRSPADMTLLDVFLAIEQSKPLFKMPLKPNIQGEQVEQARQKISESLLQAEMAMKESLKNVTLQDLLPHIGNERSL
jgi:Rrf2 family protein